MAYKNSKQKCSLWVTPSFDDFDVSSFPVEKKKRKLSKEPFAQLGKTKQQESTVLWVDLYAPTSRDDLAVHKKKVLEVESWLVESMSGMKGRKFLLLTGPAGCGKSATIQVLAREAGLNILEWINPTTTAYNSSLLDHEDTWIPGDTVTPTSQTSQFWDFLIRTSKYSSVCNASNGKNLVCVEDFPNAFFRNSDVFHTLLRKYHQRSSTSPIVFIVTDSTSQQCNAKYLFPSDLQKELSIINIMFNPIASGLLMKALSRVSSMESICEAGMGQPLPTRNALQNLAEISGGDIRSAVNALQFASKKDVYHLKELFTGSQGKARTLTRTKASSKFQRDKKLSSMHHDDGLAPIGGKNSSLYLFRAIGKVLYCKRIQEQGVIEPLPKHLQAQERVPLQENAESIFEKTAIGADSFSLFLHQNCLAFFSNIDDAEQALQHLTDADVLAAEWMGREVLEDYAASVTVRGLMHANKGGTSGGMLRPITRPQWYTVHKDGQLNASKLKDEHRMASITSEDLTTVMVPLKAKILSGKSKGFSLIKDVGSFPNVQLINASERLGEQDANVTIAEDEEGDEEGTKQCSVSNSEQQVLLSDHHGDDDPEEDFRIEEYTDDW